MYLSLQTFCCQLEELIHWLYNVTDVTDLGTAPRSSLTGLKSSLQLYRVICGPGFWLVHSRMVAKLLNYKIKSEITDAWYVVAQLIVFLKSYQRLFPEC
jgi:hypothetical protein